MPSGDVQLQFQGTGVNATVQVNGVGSNELIEILISVNGGTATIVDEARTDHKVSICHRTGTGAYNPISVSASAEPAHRAHGDAKIGEPVPGQTTLVFDEQCRAVGAAVDIEKATNGQDADSAPGPTIAVGGTVTWTYTVTNTGTEPLSAVVVTDDRGVAVERRPDDDGRGAVDDLHRLGHGHRRSIRQRWNCDGDGRVRTGHRLGRQPLLREDGRHRRRAQGAAVPQDRQGQVPTDRSGGQRGARAPQAR